jgi:phosphatidylglycerophosphate synthase
MMYLRRAESFVALRAASRGQQDQKNYLGATWARRFSSFFFAMLVSLILWRWSLLHA